jgi:excisionase family DNA binding protein
MVTLNAGRESDWANAIWSFVTNAASQGKTVRLTVEEPTYTPAEVGALVGVSRSTVQRAIEAGDIATHKRGNRHRIPEGEVERFRRKITGDLASLLANDF